MKTYTFVLVTGSYFEVIIPGSKEDLYLYKFDSKIKFIDSIRLIDRQNHQIASYKKAIIKIDSNFFVGGTDNISSSQTFVTDTTGFILIKLNSDLELLWKRKYRNNSNYVMYNMIRTKDKGILMSGIKWDWKLNPNENNNYIYLLKVDSTGYISGIQNTNFTQESIKSIYPNPSRGVFNIEFASKFHGILDIYNSIGKRVYTTIINTNYERIDLSTYNLNGLFILTFRTKNRIFYKKVVLLK